MAAPGADTTVIGAFQALALFGNFLLLSLVAIGGAIVLVPDMHRLMVEQYGLLTDVQFTAAIAIAQASPGPNVLFVAVLGYQAAGVGGAAATLLGIMLPSTSLALGVSRWGRHRQHQVAVRAFKAGMAPITIALLVCTGWVLVAQVPGWAPIVLACATALLVWRTRLHLLWLIGAGAAVGAAGWV
jgi:chromate transporter